jgi:hypothetical protein
MRSVALALLLTLPITVTRAAESSDPLKDAPPSYREALIAAMRSFTARDFDKARETVHKADSSWQQTPVSLNILGAIEIELRNFDEGRKLCLAALNKDPRFFPARFNLAGNSLRPRQSTRKLERSFSSCRKTNEMMIC